MTMTTKQYWSGHVAAVKAQAISTRAYAQQHGLALSTLYYWQNKLKLTAATQANSEPTGATGQPSKEKLSKTSDAIDAPDARP